MTSRTHDVVQAVVAHLRGSRVATTPTPAAVYGPTEIILDILREAETPLFLYQIIERAQKVDPRITHKHTNTVVYRLCSHDRIVRTGSRCSYRYTLPGAGPSACPTRAMSRSVHEAPLAAPTDKAGLGITALVHEVLRAAGVRLTLPEITERVRQINPRFGPVDVAGTLNRQRLRKRDSPVIAHGSRGRFTYTLRSADDGLPYVSRAVIGASVAANTNAIQGPELLQQILTELAERPTDDYRALTRTLFGTDDREAVERVRNRIYWLHETGKLRRRGDRAWEIPMMH